MTQPLNPQQLSAEDQKLDRRARFHIAPQLIKHCALHSGIEASDRSQIQPSALDMELRYDIEHDVLDETQHDLSLSFHVTQTLKPHGSMCYKLHITYGGVVVLDEPLTDEERLNMVLHVSAPSMLYPYIRQHVAYLTMNAGFPALQLDPINFFVLYRKHQASQSAS